MNTPIDGEIEYKSIIQQSPIYHKNWLNKIKSRVGSKCIMLRYVNYKEDYFVEARFRNEGMVKNITFKIDGRPSDVTNENYKDLEKQLMDYARTEKIIPGI